MFSLADQLALSRNRPAGFDYMRIALAAAVVCLHSMNITLGQRQTLEIVSSPLRIPVAMVLALFFALSGFLVAGSLLRCKSLISFLGLRVLRIAPALATETTLSAIIIGPIFSETPLVQYFADPKFHHYFLNIIGDVHYQLPGVFLHNPMSDVVNAQLWTVPYELWCYVILALLAATAICFNRVLYLAFLVFAQIGLIYYGVDRWDGSIVQLREPLLVFCFLSGVGFYLWRDKTPFNLPTFLFALSLCAACLSIKHGDMFAPIPAAYVTCYLGLLNPRRSWIVSSGDYSYGVFLYGFVIQQCVATFGDPVRHWGLNILISLPICFGVAFVSWHFIEKYALQLRSRLESLETAILARASFIGFRRRSPEPVNSARRLLVVQADAA
jgi:peptidoglycan/LPS O-acetylase OafA/YrhL